MSTWKVSKEQIKLFPHPNADSLELGRVGSYQVVVQKGLYKDSDPVLFVPEHSVLTGLLEQEYKTYLAGPDKNRVRSVTLRQETSAGIILPGSLVEQITGLHIDQLPYGQDLSELLGITKYEAPIPVQLAGELERVDWAVPLHRHDCEQLGVYADSLIDGEVVMVTEKLHGSQLIAAFFAGRRLISSKGLLGRGLAIKPTTSNAYWRAANEVGLWDLLERYSAEFVDGTVIQVFAELIPCQGGNWSYGQSKPTLRIFDIWVGGYSIPYHEVPEYLQHLWVPILFHGDFNLDTIRPLREGKEQVSGRQLHIREGIVVRPHTLRRASDGTWLQLKLINPLYKQTGEEIN